MTTERQHLTRRTVLAGLGTVGVAAAGAGLGTTALFNDREGFFGNTLTAGSLDLLLDYKATYDGPDGNVVLGQVPTPAEEQAWEDQFGGEIDYCSEDGQALLINGTEIPVFELHDVKPGDSGEVTVSLHICDNPAWVTMSGSMYDNLENGQTEPELADEGDDVDGVGELADLIEVTMWYDPNCNNVLDDGEVVLFEGSMADAFTALEAGIGLDGDASTPEFDPVPGASTYCIGFYWELPVEVGNEVQTDSVSFDLVFDAEQSRHNPVVTTSQGEGFADLDDTSFARARFGGTNTWELAVGIAPGNADEGEYTWTSGDTVPFVYTHDGSGNATFELDGVTVADSITAPGGRFAVQGKVDEATIAVDNLALTVGGDAVGLVGPDTLVVSNDDGVGPRDIQHLVVNTSAAQVSGPFSVSGDVTVTLQGDYDTSAEEGVALDLVFE
ncbi:choice-of-anchor W domain-containing protein [Haloarchaeobius litoreus]|uniref:Choice-of-anchor W domain-containing protein n=1 Tax=Haloarchaeobius litoreus TaxID=755306 RepID=A0ABD6DGW3_9EURY|nr:choice-of-anchor W domain-containing protein [Haloarchaeobius litoreus]